MTTGSTEELSAFALSLQSQECRTRAAPYILLRQEDLLGGKQMKTQRHDKPAAQVLQKRLEGIAQSILSVDQQLLKESFSDSELYVQALGLMRVTESHIRGMRQILNASQGSM
jgi:hypothetical protein